MTCDQLRRNLDAYIDRELELGKSLEIERHLQTCPSCEEAHLTIESVRTAVTTPTLYHRAPPGLLDQLKSSPASAPPQPSFRIGTWKLVAAAMFMIVASVAISLAVSHRASRTQLADEAIASHVRSLMVDHLADVVSTDQHTVKPWFNGKIDFSPPVVDPAAEGFPLTGGRLDYLSGRPVAALVYRRRQHVINLFVWPDDASLAASERHTNGYNVIEFAEGGMHHVACSDLNDAELRQFVGLIRAAQAAHPATR